MTRDQHSVAKHSLKPKEGNVTVLEDRLAKLDKLVLGRGNHAAPNNGFVDACVMEAVAYVAGEPWSDRPQCASKVLTSFCMTWNDGMNDEDRQRLKPYIPRLVGTAGDAKSERIRAWMATDWFVRVSTPTWLRLAGCEKEAATLEALTELTDAKSAKAAQPALSEAKRAGAAAWAAARAAAGDAARAAAWDAAWDAAGDAAWDAARAAAWDAAGDAAWDAARAAARAAAWDAAGAAARDALRPTVVALQDSAFELLDRMIAVTEEKASA